MMAACRTTGSRRRPTSVFNAHRGGVHPPRHERVGIAGAAGAGPEVGPVAQHPRERPDPRRPALPGGAAGRDANGCATSGWRARGSWSSAGDVEAFSAEELGDDDKVEVLRAYLRRWKMEVGRFFDGVSADSTDDELRRIAPEHPVFRITTSGA